MPNLETGIIRRALIHLYVEKNLFNEVLGHHTGTTLGCFRSYGSTLSENDSVVLWRRGAGVKLIGACMEQEIYSEA